MEADHFYPGKRLSYEGHLCTVRYLGPVAGTTGAWLGVEWDDTTRGKHNGFHRGVQVFECLSRAPTCASFVRPSRKADQERTVLEAIRYKYDAADVVNDTIVISGKVAEEVGFDKIAKAQSQLRELRIVLIDQLLVSGLARKGQDIAQAQAELRQTCPSIVELDLGYNFIEEWSTITNICAALPNLTTLRVGGLRFRSEFTFTAPLLLVKELHLEECLLSSDQIVAILGSRTGLPCLETLYLSGNQLDELTIPTDKGTLAQRLSTLVLENNLFTDLACLHAITTTCPAVSYISLQGNQISTIGTIPSAKIIPQVTSLNVSENEITCWNFVDTLSALLPNLKSLRITNNPVYKLQDSETQDPRASDKLFYVTLARIPSLTSLNHSSISAKDRTEGEIYYLSVAEKEIREFITSCNTSTNRADIAAQARRLHPQYQLLAQKYDRDSILDLQDKSTRTGVPVGIEKPKYAQGSLGARLVQATFYLSGETSNELRLSLPSTLAASQVMALLLRQPVFIGKLRPLQFSMIYESEELDPVDTTTESTTKGAMYGKRLTAEEKRDLWKEWGDWDADAVVAKALTTGVDGSNLVQAETGRWIENGKVLLKDGRQWKRRTVAIPPSLKRAWGDFLDGASEVRIRLCLQ